jgi:uncharacterized protein YndB with AHSA1/START domain
MQLDVERVIGTTVREVAERMHEGRIARALVARREYATSADDLWDALTNPERIPRWFLPVTGDLRLGGRYQLQGNAGGTITTCEPPRALGLTWEHGGGVSWVTVQLQPQGADRTLLQLEHLAHVDDHWTQYGPGAAGVGWDMALTGLGLHLTSRAPVDPKAFEQWMTSEEGLTFIRLSSSGWGQAAMAAGTPEADARAAADRTTAFYTGS